MPKFQISANIPSPPEKLIEIATDYENFGRFFKYIDSIKILEDNADSTITEEKISFTLHKLSHTIVQKTKTKKYNSKIEAEVIEGPLKGSVIKTNYEKISSGSKVSIDADLKISLKYKFLGPIISKRIKMASIAVLYKMHTLISESDQ